MHGQIILALIWFLSSYGEQQEYSRVQVLRLNPAQRLQQCLHPAELYIPLVVLIHPHRRGQPQMRREGTVEHTHTHSEHQINPRRPDPVNG